ncbi:MAG: hypothetical protein ACUVXI_13675 [bacterium]
MRLGELLIREGMITSEQLDLALEHQRKYQCLLGEALVQLGFVDFLTILKAVKQQEDEESLREAVRKSRLRLGEALVLEGKITEDQLRQGLELQKEQGCPLGEALIQLGFVAEEDVRRVLKKR